MLDERDNWNVVAMPYYRFFNHGERYADTVDWSTARVMDKVDGSLVILVRARCPMYGWFGVQRRGTLSQYYYAGTWHVGTGGSPSAGGTTSGTTFAALFWDTFRKLGYRKPTAEHRE